MMINTVRVCFSYSSPGYGGWFAFAGINIDCCRYSVVFLYHRFYDFKESVYSHECSEENLVPSNRDLRFVLVPSLLIDSLCFSKETGFSVG